jgi:hypothetical protein
MIQSFLYKKLLNFNKFFIIKNTKIFLKKYKQKQKSERNIVLVFIIDIILQFLKKNFPEILVK